MVLTSPEECVGVSLSSLARLITLAVSNGSHVASSPRASKNYHRNFQNTSICLLSWHERYMMQLLSDTCEKPMDDKDGRTVQNITRQEYI